jgi:Family of unknown function (DUF6504)
VSKEKQFISQPIEALEASGTELPRSFRRHAEVIEVRTVRKEWRGTKEDRGDVYLKRHWYEFEAADGRILTVYFDRAAKPGRPRWWLYTIE